ncbi:BQ2448_5199 [Microbotryum intermedium]|uniref:BQ2448_5199 protein n=1 Tax=Microbotryum intermedium TaxID=269621 RepID=A0A238F8U1_9BASI|nr:BQ2448_5199 [Microbotryum intermedium]
MPRFFSHLAALVAPLPRVSMLFTRRSSNSSLFRLFGGAPRESAIASLVASHSSSSASTSVPSNDVALLNSTVAKISPAAKSYDSSLSIQAPGVPSAPRLPSILADVVRSDRRRAAFRLERIESTLNDDAPSTTTTPISSTIKPVSSTSFKHPRGVAAATTALPTSSIPFPRKPTRASKANSVLPSSSVRSDLFQPKKNKTAALLALLPSAMAEIEKEEEPEEEPKSEDETSTDPRFVDLRSITRPRQKLRASRRKVDDGRWLVLTALDNSIVAREVAVAEAMEKASAVLEERRRPFLEIDDEDDDTDYFARLPSWSDSKL